MCLIGIGDVFLITGIVVVSVLFAMFVALVFVGMVHSKREQEFEASLSGRERELANQYGIEWVKENRKRKKQGRQLAQQLNLPDGSAGFQFDATNPAYADLVKAHNGIIDRAAKLREQQRIESARLEQIEEEERRVKESYFLQRELELQTEREKRVLEENRENWEREFQERKNREV